eukprot:m.46126 g.46126  ORF g.46126 m.46126 type:complete len:903 (-) comp11828_c0_seq1:528-3236(-)
MAGEHTTAAATAGGSRTDTYNRPLRWLLLLGLLAAASTQATGQQVVPSLGPGRDFVLRNHTRCSGHYSVSRVEGDGFNRRRACERVCRGDDKCASFSLEQDSQGQCFLFDSGATCQRGSGWETGHRDTRCAQADEDSALMLSCPFGSVISRVAFASYGKPSGQCGGYRQHAQCHSDSTLEVVRDLCVGESECTVSAADHVFGDPCPGETKNLRIRVECEAGKSFNEDVYFNAWSSRNWRPAETEVEARREEWKSYLAALPPYPSGSFSDRGIIIVAGGRYLPPAVVLIHMLREAGCELRIQVWHLGDKEMTHEHKRLLAPYNVETRNFEDYVPTHLLQPVPANVGMRLFQLKPLAILHSDLEDVLLLDSDNCPIHDPSYLFEATEFVKTGTIFWPDYWKTSLENPIWRIIEHKPVDTWEQESGQIMLSKRRAWEALNLCVHFNNEYYMKLLNGDKDTFRFAWMAAGVPYYMMPTSPESVGTLKELHSDAGDTGFCGHTMIQHGFQGEPVFVHHNQLKTTHLPVGENFRFRKTPLIGSGSPSWKAVPVPGLRLPSGVLLSCISIESLHLHHVDEDACAISESGLGDFERRYIKAQAMVPILDVITHERAATVDLPGNQPLVLTADALRRQRRNTTSPGTGDCASGEFELVTDLCETITPCDPAETQGASATSTSDTECSTTGGAPLPEINVQSTGSLYRLQDDSSSGSQFISRPTVTLTKTGTYQFNMLSVPASEPFVITTALAGGPGSPEVSGMSFSGGASGNDVLLYTPPLTQSGNVYYQSTTQTGFGARIVLTEPSWEKMYVGIPVRGSFSGPFLRFSTAYNPNVRVLQMKAGPTDQNFVALRSPCQDECLSTPMCRGIFIYRTDEGSVCNGLSDLGTSPVSTKVESQSWGVELNVAVSA